MSKYKESITLYGNSFDVELTLTSFGTQVSEVGEYLLYCKPKSLYFYLLNNKLSIYAGKVSTTALRYYLSLNYGKHWVVELSESNLKLKLFEIEEDNYSEYNAIVDNELSNFFISRINMFIDFKH